MNENDVCLLIKVFFLLIFKNHLYLSSRTILISSSDKLNLFFVLQTFELYGVKYGVLHKHSRLIDYIYGYLKL